jgi:energy-coupling factor transporter ATP-binding protein EcfA2
MPPIAEITNQPRGARFVRADLHIHSYLGSHDVKDTTATPEAIVATAAHEGLKVIAVTDHNEIGNVAAAIAAGLQAELFVIPAIELSAPEGHLLGYLPTIDALQRFYGQIDIGDRGTQTSHCRNGMLDCLNKLHALGGFGILAHVDGPSGLETEVPGASPHKLNILCHPALLGIELAMAGSPIGYSDQDPDAIRVGIGRERIKRLGLGAHQFIARVLDSDAHTLQALGRNARGDRKVTRYKMNSLTFESLRIALDDSDARVRIEDELPAAVPTVKGLRMSGGFLDGESIHFGPNLNCIIGGRGTGKSTTFEVVRCLTGQPGGSSVVDSDAWPDRIDLLFEDQAGQVHHLTRARGGEVDNAEDPFDGPISFAVECYGQGETHQISQRAQNDPGALLEYLDRFVDVRNDIASEEDLRGLLLDLQSKIEHAAAQVERIPQYQRNLTLTQSQLRAAEKANAKEIIALQRKVEQERQIRAAILQKTQAIVGGVSQQSIKENIAGLKGVADPKTLVVGGVEFGAILAQTTTFETDLGAADAGLKASATRLSNLVTAQLATWRAKEQPIVKEIDDKKRELEAQGIRVDMAYIQKLAADEARLQQEVANLKTWQPALTSLWTQRRKVLVDRWTARSRIATRRNAFGQKASAALRAALADLNVTLKFETSGYAPAANAIITDTMGWRTIQVPRASVLTEKLTVPLLLDAIGRKDPEPIVALRTDEGGAVFNRAEAMTLIERLAPDPIRFQLERCEVFDRPRLTVTREYTDANGRKAHRTREFRHLSLGQQQSVLLALMLSADSNTPLIIDQPEDNLDGEFIYQSLVPVLRRAKERRQVIVVTHNANIAVLGDAEQIIVLRANNERAVITNRGSIDDADIRAAACAILEGSEEAFRRRARIYGL